MNQQAKEHSILMGYDAMRICTGLNPKHFSATEVIRWIELLTDTPDLHLKRAKLALAARAA